MKDLFIKRFEYYKMLGDKSFEQLSDEQIFGSSMKRVIQLPLL